MSNCMRNRRVQVMQLFNDVLGLRLPVVLKLSCCSKGLARASILNRGSTASHCLFPSPFVKYQVEMYGTQGLCV